MTISKENQALLNMLNLCYTKRWVIAPLLREQSVAEHTFRVMVIVRILHVVCPFNVYTALLLAMEHDSEEAVTGDIPGAHKDTMHDWPDPSSMTREAVVVKVADALETYDWWQKWGAKEAWVHQFSPGAGDSNREIRKIHHFCRDWPELLDAVWVVMASYLGYDLTHIPFHNPSVL